MYPHEMEPDAATVMAETRKAMAPAPGTKGSSERVCTDCGVVYWDWTNRTRRVCADCAAARQQAHWALQSALSRRAQSARLAAFKGGPG